MSWLWKRLNKLELALAVLICLAVYSGAFPYGFPLFFPLVLLMFVWFGLLQKRLTLPTNTGFALLVGCVLFYLMGLLGGSKLYEENAKDLRNISSILLASPLLFSLRGANDFSEFRKDTQVVSANLSLFIAGLGLYKYWLLLGGTRIDLIWVEGRPYPWGTSLTTDYNFFAFAMLVGAISSLYCYPRSSSFGGKLWYSASFCLSALSMALAGSRRGWVTEAVFLLGGGCLLFGMFILFVLRPRRRLAVSMQTLRGVLAVFILAALSLAAWGRYGRDFLWGHSPRAAGTLNELLLRADTLSDPRSSFAARADRWQYAVELLNQASATQLVFGQGFDYLPRFASRFLTRTEEDYPHNPVLSAVLYSGILGGSWVALFMALALAKFYQYRGVDTYFFALYFASLWFILPSFNSVVSDKFFPLLLLLPWLLQSIAPRLRYESLSPCPEQVYSR